MVEVKSDIEIARAAKKRPILEIGAKLGIPPEHLLPYGHDKAKIGAEFIAAQKDRKNGHLILVTAINPTPAGEGKTTTTVGLGDGLNRIGKKAIVCIREASLGPCFGVKGGAAGGGYAQVRADGGHEPSFHRRFPRHHLRPQPACGAARQPYLLGQRAEHRHPAHFLATGDGHERSGAARTSSASLGGVANGYPRETGFDITVASEVMAILCLSMDLKDLEKRLGNIIIGYRRDKSPVLARDIKADGAMTVLLKDAMQPNLVQTLENNPAFVHGGPFANIAHGCNSVIATTTALKLADYVVTEAGFGADLGAEKFFDIKCRKAGLKPDAAVIVATVRAIKMNGGVKKDDLGKENLEALRKGCANLGRHVQNVKKFGVPAIVAINHFTSDTEAEVQAIKDYVATLGAEAVLCRHWAEGSAGIEELARKVAALAEGGHSQFSTALSRRDAAVPQDRDDRQGHLSRQRSDRRQVGARSIAHLGGSGLRPPADLHGQDAIFVFDRPEPARRADGPHGADPRSAACRRRRLHRRHHRRNHDDAGPAEGAVIGEDLPQSAGLYRRPVLEQFQEKCEAVFRQEMRKNKEIERLCDSV